MSKIVLLMLFLRCPSNENFEVVSVRNLFVLKKTLELFELINISMKSYFLKSSLMLLTNLDNLITYALIT